MTVIKWKMNLFQADAERCYHEIVSIGESATPKQIVDFGRNPDTELHKCFEWNDSIAAEQYRIQQARHVVCNLVIVEETQKTEPKKLRLLQRADEGYKPVELIVQNKSEYERLLERARAELSSFKQRYHMLVELEEILALID